MTDKPVRTPKQYPHYWGYPHLVELYKKTGLEPESLDPNNQLYEHWPLDDDPDVCLCGGKIYRQPTTAICERGVMMLGAGFMDDSTEEAGEAQREWQKKEPFILGIEPPAVTVGI